jgi:branched-chain amino acid transport system permease protein
VSQSAEAAAPIGRRLRLHRSDPAYFLTRGGLLAVGVFVLLWVLVLAKSALTKQPETFLVVLLNGLTLAGLYFVVSSGFTLIFGLMRVVNMAHGSLYMLAGFFALKLQERFVSADPTQGFGAPPTGVGDWVFPLVIAALAVAVIGLVMQQIFLRWNQGQDLRQALITIAISVIIADQAVANFGGIAEEITPPDVFPDSVNLHVYGLHYPFFRIFVLLVAIAVGIALWAAIKRTRYGMIVRAGVDSFGDVYLPAGYTNYSVLLIFALLVAVLAVRPLGLFGRPA